MNLFLCVSHHGSGDIGVFALAPESGRLRPVSRVRAGPFVMPLAVGPNGHFLHAVIRSRPYQVISYHIDATTGDLARIGATPLPQSMVAAVVDRSGRWLLTAAYGEDALCVHQIDAQGRIAREPAQMLASGGCKPHALCLDRANRLLHVPHLGSDEVRSFTFDAASGTLAPCDPQAATVAPGSGPRHLVLSPDEGRLYVLGQLDGRVEAFARDPASGRLTPIGTADALRPGSGLAPGVPRPPSGSPDAAAPETDRVWCADIQIPPSGRFLYTTERAQSMITTLALDPASGMPRYAGHRSTEQQPRAIAIDPHGRYLVSAGEASAHLAVYRIDAESGALTPSDRVATGQGPNWMVFVAPPADLRRADGA